MLFASVVENREARHQLPSSPGEAAGSMPASHSPRSQTASRRHAKTETGIRLLLSILWAQPLVEAVRCNSARASRLRSATVCGLAVPVSDRALIILWAIFASLATVESSPSSAARNGLAVLARHDPDNRLGPGRCCKRRDPSLTGTATPKAARSLSDRRYLCSGRRSRQATLATERSELFVSPPLGWNGPAAIRVQLHLMDRARDQQQSTTQPRRKASGERARPAGASAPMAAA